MSTEAESTNCTLKLSVFKAIRRGVEMPFRYAEPATAALTCAGSDDLPFSTPTGSWQAQIYASPVRTASPPHFRNPTRWRAPHGTAGRRYLFSDGDVKRTAVGRQGTHSVVVHCDPATPAASNGGTGFLVLQAPHSRSPHHRRRRTSMRGTGPKGLHSALQNPTRTKRGHRGLRARIQWGRSASTKAPRLRERKMSVRQRHTRQTSPRMAARIARGAP